MARKKRLNVELPESGRGSWKHPEVPGLEARGNSRGAVWTLRHRVGGKRVRDSIGRWPGLSPEAARDVAETRLKAAAVMTAAGGDALAQRDDKRSQERRARLASTFEAMLGTYCERHLSGLKSGPNAEAAIRDVFKPLLSKSVASITRDDIVDVIAEKRKTTPSYADLDQRNVKAFISWSSAEGLCENVTASLKTPQTAERDRTLSLGELGAVWTAVEDADGVGERIVKMLVLTALRRDEVAHMKIEEVDRDRGVWVIPGSRMKNGMSHAVPLVARSACLLDEAIGDRSEGFVFEGSVPGKPFSGWSRLKKRIDRTSKTEGWRLHDLRRTFCTHAADRGVDVGVADMILSHKLGASVSTAGRVYQRSALFEQRRRALELWQDVVIEAAARAKSENVVEMKRG